MTTGLSSQQVAERVAAGQTNAYQADSSRSIGSIIRTNVFSLFNGIVFACFFVLFLLGRWQDALFGFAAIMNAIIGAFQEFKAKAALDKLALLNAAQARVLRDGVESEIAPTAVVLGDALVLRAGDQVPADAKVIDSRGLQIDESMLTGESDPVDKQAGATALSGSVVVAGEGTAEVSAVGADSYANQFASEAKRFTMMRSELQSSVNRVLKWVAWGIAPIGLLVFNAQIHVAGGYEVAFTTGTWVQATVNVIASLTAMIPLGLVLMTSLAFAVGAAKLARRQILVNELPAVEGLARVDVICLDKTGTLTAGEIVFDQAHPLDEVAGWQQVLAWIGTAPDANATARCLREPYPQSDLEKSAYIPFSSARKWSAVSFDDTESWVFGAPEMVFSDAAADTATPLGAAVQRLADAGLRTLVLGHAPVGIDGDGEELPAGLAPVAVLTFREQVRPDAAQTLAYFTAQGVGIRVISGDNPRTVAAIGRQVGLDVTDGFDARQLPEDEAELADVLEKHLVFGRVTPEQKQRMVVALQSRGHTVAMTGDGVNDALAIKTADIGIAMNSGAAATKAVARLVLLDGQFSHLPDVVAEGRQVIANIERVSMLFLTKTVYATALAILFGVFVLEFPFLPRQLSITDGLTIGIPAFFLALMPNAQRYIPGFLRRSLSFAIPAGLTIALGLLWFDFIAHDAHAPVEHLRTGATILLAITGIWVLSVLARPLNRFKVAVVGAMFIGLVIVFTVPLSTEFFQLVDPGELLAVVLVGVALIMVVVIEIVRLIHRRRFAAALPQQPSRPMPAGAATILTIVTVIVYASGFLAIGLGILEMLSRYQAESKSEELTQTLAGVATALFGMLILAVAVGVRRGSGLSRLLVSIYLGLILVAVALLVPFSDEPWVAITMGVVGLALIVVLWVPPASRGFSTLLHSSVSDELLHAERAQHPDAASVR